MSSEDFLKHLGTYLRFFRQVLLASEYITLLEMRSSTFNGFKETGVTFIFFNLNQPSQVPKVRDTNKIQ